MERKRKIFKENTQIEGDLGIGNKVTGHSRLIDKNGQFRVDRRGVNIWKHPYQLMIELPWLKFHVVIVAFYLSVNILFAAIYVALGTDSLSGDQNISLLDFFLKAYFFSMQTFTTVGYGSIYPVSFLSNIVAALEALFALLTFALVTGLYYAKFTNPESKINFSDIGVIAPFRDGINGFMFRIVNHSTSQVIDVEAMVTYSFLQDDHNGIKRRLFRQMTLERNKVSLFPLNWTIVHPIDENSPLWGKTHQELIESDAEFIVFIKGQDITFGHAIHANGSYLAKELRWGHKFDPMYYADEVYGTVLELDKINHTSAKELHEYA